MELRLAVHDSVFFKLGYAMVFKLQLGESVVENTLEILGGCRSPFKLWRLYIGYPWSVHSPK